IVGFTDHTAVADCWMLQQHCLNLGGRNREAFALDQLFAAVDDLVKPSIVAHCHISRPVPTISQYFARGIGRIEISLHELWPTHDEFAGLAWGGIVTGFVHQPAVSLRDGMSDRVRPIK